MKFIRRPLFLVLFLFIFAICSGCKKSISLPNDPSIGFYNGSLISSKNGNAKDTTNARVKVFRNSKNVIFFNGIINPEISITIAEINRNDTGYYGKIEECNYKFLNGKTILIRGNGMIGNDFIYNSKKNNISFQFTSKQSDTITELQFTGIKQ